MDLDQLQAFDRIVRAGSFSRAAWELGIAQPTISARIQALEQAVGGPLLTRAGRRVGLTPLGAEFLPYAQRALALLAEGVAQAQQAQAGLRGRLTLGVLGSLAGCVLGPALAAFAHARPQAECYVRGGSQQKVIELLRDGVVELGLATWPCANPPQAELEPLLLLRERVVPIVPRRHPLAGQAAVSADELAGQAAPLLLVRWWQATPALVARVVARAPSVANVPPETARALLREGVGASFFTEPQAAELLESGVCAELTLAGEPPLWRESALVRLARPTPASPIAAEFVAALRAYAGRRGLLAPETR